jgi:hypothetical protein
VCEGTRINSVFTCAGIEALRYRTCNIASTWILMASFILQKDTIMSLAFLARSSATQLRTGLSWLVNQGFVYTHICKQNVMPTENITTVCYAPLVIHTYSTTLTSQQSGCTSFHTLGLAEVDQIQDIPTKSLHVSMFLIAN